MISTENTFNINFSLQTKIQINKKIASKDKSREHKTLNCSEEIIDSRYLNTIQPFSTAESAHSPCNCFQMSPIHISHCLWSCLQFKCMQICLLRTRKGRCAVYLSWFVAPTLFFQRDVFLFTGDLTFFTKFVTVFGRVSVFPLAMPGISLIFPSILHENFCLNVFLAQIWTSSFWGDNDSGSPSTYM